MNAPRPTHSRTPSAVTSVDKAFEVCEVLSGAPAGLSLTEVSRQLKQPRPSVHRLLGVLKRRGYVRQDEQTQRYVLTLKMLDLSFRLLGRSELRLHAYPVLREFVVRTGQRAFIAIPAAGEVTYVWSSGADEVSMWTGYGKEMPAHCSIYFDAAASARRLSCVKLVKPSDVGRREEVLRRLGAAGAEGAQRLFCTCAPVHDYTGREVARVGIFGHGPDDRPVLGRHGPEAWEMARHISLRLGHLPAESVGQTA